MAAAISGEQAGLDYLGLLKAELIGHVRRARGALGAGGPGGAVCRVFREMVLLYGEGGLRPVIDRVFPLAQAAEAHRRMDEGAQMGKIVLKIT